MMVAKVNTIIPSLPQVTIPWVDAEGRPVRLFANYMVLLDQLKHPGVLVDAANDAAAKTAGVMVGELYRSGSQVMVRVT
jgi:hypothetical protein